MTTFPFTDAGVRSKTQELYMLPDDMLRAETEHLRIDFKSWIHAHFELRDDQAAYLENMEYPFIQILAGDIADCIEWRLPLGIHFPTFPIGSKFIKPDSKLVRSAHPIKGYQVEGELDIYIVYE